MKFILLLVSLTLASATLSDCEKELLRNCRECDLPSVPSDKSCPLVGYDCDVNEEELGKFNRSNGRFLRDCDSLRCDDPAATLFVDGVPYKSIACSENLWRFGKHYTLNTTTAACIKRCDNCKNHLNRNVPRSKSAEMIPPVITSPPSVHSQCASAKCLNDYKLHGLSDDGVDKEINGNIRCTGNRIWVDDQKNQFQHVYCVPITAS